jgi:hypothetical protein
LVQAALEISVVAQLPLVVTEPAEEVVEQAQMLLSHPHRAMEMAARVD